MESLQVVVNFDQVNTKTVHKVKKIVGKDMQELKKSKKAGVINHVLIEVAVELFGDILVVIIKQITENENGDSSKTKSSKKKKNQDDFDYLNQVVKEKQIHVKFEGLGLSILGYNNDKRLEMCYIQFGRIDLLAYQSKQYDELQLKIYDLQIDNNTDYVNTLPVLLTPSKPQALKDKGEALFNL